MNMVEYAANELRRAGLFDEDSDYDGMLGDAVLEIVKVFSKQGHSGMSAAMVTAILEKLLRYEPLTPLTSDPDEWMNVSDIAGAECWQSTRDPSVFSRDGGKTWYSIDDPSKNNGDVHERVKWLPYELGDENIKPGHRARVKPDAYSAGSGLEVNGKEGVFAGARNGYAYIKYDGDSDTAGAAHNPDAIEVEAP